MRIQIQLRIVADDDSVISADEILHLDKGDDESMQKPCMGVLVSSSFLCLRYHFHPSFWCYFVTTRNSRRYAVMERPLWDWG